MRGRGGIIFAMTRPTTFVVAGVLLACLAAAPATQPDVSTYPALQKRLAQLSSENTSLKAKVAELTETIRSMKADADSAKAAATAKAASENQDSPKLGMTESEALACFGNRFGHETVHEDAEGKVISIFGYSSTSSGSFGGIQSTGNSHKFTWGQITFDKSGKATSIDKN